MSQIILTISTDNKPKNLASPEVIVQQVRAARASIMAANANANSKSNSRDLRGVPLVDESHGGVPYAWVKYGRSVTMHEAQVQQFVAQSVNDKADATVRVPYVYLAFKSGAFGYIVMQYIGGSTCDDSHAELVAAAVQSLIAVKGPTEAPGPVDEGPIKHHFFYDSQSSKVYKSVKLLEDHVNGILAREKRGERVNFQSEVKEHGLPFCPCDLDHTNFMRDHWGKIVAIDFGASCFLPRSFFDFTLYQSDKFPQLIRLLKRPQPAHLNAMLEAHSTILLHGTNKIGEPKDLQRSN